MQHIIAKNVIKEPITLNNKQMNSEQPKQYTTKKGKEMIDGEPYYDIRNGVLNEFEWQEQGLSSSNEEALFLVQYALEPLTANTAEEAFGEYWNTLPEDYNQHEMFKLVKESFMAGRQSCNRITYEKTREGAIEIVMNTGTRGAELIVDCKNEEITIGQACNFCPNCGVNINWK